MSKTIYILLVSVICFSFTSDIQKKVLRQNEFDIECYVSLKEINTFQANKTYYWYKTGAIHTSLSSSSGNVLHRLFSKYYRSNQIAEKGEFNFGLKTGIWKTWYENGQLKLQEQWNNGYRNGSTKVFDDYGNLIIKGNYKNNIKTGQWIDYRAKDTTYYKKDSIYHEKPKGFIQRVLRKRDSLEKVQIKTERINKRKSDSIKRAQLKLNRKTKKTKDSLDSIHKKQKNLLSKKPDKKNDNGFFKRLFKKGK